MVTQQGSSSLETGKYPVSQQEFIRRGLYSMKKFYETCCDEEFVSALLIQISRSYHFPIMSKTKPQRKDIFI